MTTPEPETTANPTGVISDTVEESVGRWRRLLSMEDGGHVRQGEAFSDSQRELIQAEYRALPQEERLLFCMGLNAFLGTALMDVTMTIKDAELSCENGTSSQEGDEEAGAEDDDVMMMQRQKTTPRPSHQPQGQAGQPRQFGLLLQTFASALQRLPDQQRGQVARTLKRWLAQECGQRLGDNA